MIISGILGRHHPRKTILTSVMTLRPTCWLVMAWTIPIGSAKTKAIMREMM